MPIATPDDPIEKFEINNLISYCLKELKKNNMLLYQLIYDYYYKELTYKQLANKYGYPQTDVFEMCREALHRTSRCVFEQLSVTERQ